MSFAEAARIALASLRANKLRSFLTVLGILIGVSSVIAVVAITEGLDRYIAKQVLELGSNSFTVQKMPDIITSLGEFERMYGDGRRLEFTDAGTMDNYVWHAARAFFEEGGKRLYIVRTYRPETDTAGNVTSDGRAVGWLPDNERPSDADAPRSVRIQARFPGKAGAMRVRVKWVAIDYVPNSKLAPLDTRSRLTVSPLSSEALLPAGQLTLISVASGIDSVASRATNCAAKAAAYSNSKRPLT